jgi:hypothetical protein
MSGTETHSSERLTRRKIPQPFTSRNIGKLPAWLVSLLFHFTVLTAIATLWTSRSGGTGQEQGGPIGIAVVYETASGSEEFFLSDSEGASQQTQESAASSLPAASSANQAQAALLEGLLPSGTGPGGDALDAVGSLGLGDGGGKIGGSTKAPKAKTSVFGIEGEGSRFLYVFDRSDSMNGEEGRPFRTAKSELLTSLESLGPTHQFQIIFYNDTPLPYGGMSERGPQILRGDEQSKENAQRFVKNMVAVGGTQHIDAMRMALAMSPDVIFFLTDADYPEPSSRDIESILVRASRAGTTIHTIQFGSGPNQDDGGWIRRIAEGTLGKYRYVNVAEFAVRSSDASQAR